MFINIHFKKYITLIPSLRVLICQSGNLGHSNRAIRPVTFDKFYVYPTVQHRYDHSLCAHEMEKTGEYSRA